MRAGGREIEIRRPDKVLFPAEEITKADVAEYYRRIARLMLPHVRDRPLHMRRFPDGIEGEVIEQKRVPRHFPAWISRARLRRKEGGSITHVLCQDAATLVYLAGQVVEPHVWLSRKDRLEHPDQLVFDLDPAGRDFAPVRAAARALRDVLAELGLDPFLKSTGGRGLHVVVPLARRAEFDEVRSFAQDVAELLAARHPEQLTTEQRKQKRRGRLYLDTARNAYAQTVIAPYAVRARPGAAVAVPLAWEDLGRFEPGRFTVRDAAKRLERRRDPWAVMRRRARSLGEPRRRLEGLLEAASANG